MRLALGGGEHLFCEVTLDTSTLGVNFSSFMDYTPELQQITPAQGAELRRAVTACVLRGVRAHAAQISQTARALTIDAPMTAAAVSAAAAALRVTHGAVVHLL